MAIRIRRVQDQLVALCVVETDPQEGDIYLDDGLHEALAQKFARDYELDWECDKTSVLAWTQKVRDARDVMESQR